MVLVMLRALLPVAAVPVRLTWLIVRAVVVLMLPLALTVRDDGVPVIVPKESAVLP